MDLLQDRPFNFRYYLMTTKSVDDKPKVYIFYWYSPNNIGETETTQFETVELPNLHEIWDDEQTEMHTVYSDEVQINEFNSNIVNYLKSRKDTGIYQIRLICANYNYDKIVFEPRVFMEMLKCCTNIYIDIKDCAFRTENIEYPTISKLEVKSGTLLLDSTTLLRIDEASIIDMTISVHNKLNNDCYCNFMVNKSFLANSLHLYSTLKTAFTCTTKDPNTYMDSATLNLLYVNIFGGETIEKDHINERISITGFNKAMINVIDIDDDVKYGTIFKFKQLTSVSINEAHRNIDQVTPGSFIIMDTLATLNLHYFNVVIKEDALVNKNYSLISFTPDTSDLIRKINIYDTEVINESPVTIAICALKNVDIQALYMSQCTIHDNIVPFVRDDRSKLVKLYYNKCNIDSKLADIKIDDVKALSITDSNFDSHNHSIIINSGKLSISGGEFKFNKFKVFNNKVSIYKIAMEKVELIGDTFSITNPESVLHSTSFFDNGSKFNVKHIHLNKFKPTFRGTLFRSEDLTFNTETSVTMSEAFIVPTNNKENKINLNCSASCNIFYDGSVFRPLEINIDDKKQFYSRNKLFITKVHESDINFDFKTNAPVTYEFYNCNPDYIHFIMSDDYESDQISHLKFNIFPDEEMKVKIMNDSEKKCIITDGYYDEGKLCFSAKKIENK